MTCIQAQSLITPFIKDKLNNKELEEFLEHINACSNCREELEVYYTLMTAMSQLDEDKNLSDNFSLDLKEKLQKAQDKIVHAKLSHYRKIGSLVLILMLFAFVLSLEHSILEKEKKRAQEMNFKLKVLVQEEKYHILDPDLYHYFENLQPDQNQTDNNKK